MYEHHFQCPYCWEEISMLLDPSVSSIYVEVFEVCGFQTCVTYTVQAMYVEGFDASPIV